MGIGPHTGDNCFCYDFFYITCNSNKLWHWLIIKWIPHVHIEDNKAKKIISVFTVTFVPEKFPENPRMAPEKYGMYVLI